MELDDAKHSLTCSDEEWATLMAEVAIESPQFSNLPPAVLRLARTFYDWGATMGAKWALEQRRERAGHFGEVN